MISIADFKDIANAVQSIIIALGIIVGGLWTWITFGALKTRDQAIAQLKRINREIREQANIVVSIDVACLNAEPFSSRYISANVKIQNLGNKNLTLDFSDYPPFRVARCVMESGVPESFEICHRARIPSLSAELDSYTWATSITLMALGSVELPFLVSVDSAGTYLLEFAVRTPFAEKETAVQSGADPKSYQSWRARTYLVVE